jgi:hypothetical protein
MNPWTKEEDNCLELFVGDKLWPTVPSTYNQWARRNGFPERTRTALLKRVELKRWRRRVEGAWITTGTIAQALNLSYRAPEYWIAECGLPATRLGEGRSYPYYIRRSDLVKFARRRRDLFAGYPRRDLYRLLEDPELAIELAGMRRQRPRMTAVQCVETGQRFKSISEAARAAAFVSSQRLRQVLDEPTRTANGHHWISVS